MSKQLVHNAIDKISTHQIPYGLETEQVDFQVRDSSQSRLCDDVLVNFWGTGEQIPTV